MERTIRRYSFRGNNKLFSTLERNTYWNTFLGFKAQQTWCALQLYIKSVPVSMFVKHGLPALAPCSCGHWKQNNCFPKGYKSIFTDSKRKVLLKRNYLKYIKFKKTIWVFWCTNCYSQSMRYMKNLKNFSSVVWAFVYNVLIPAQVYCYQ